jgi:Zn-dependent protease
MPTKLAEGWVLFLRYLDLLRVSPWLFIVFFGSVVTALLVGIAFHEFSHALVASSLGDPTARRLGRLSLDPRVHLDPFGTLLLFIGGFGWGKPVPVNGHRLRNGEKAGMGMVAAAGPLSNLLMAGLMAAPIKAGLVPWHTPFLVPVSVSHWQGDDYLGLFLSAVVIFNVVLAVFNLIPLAPLDGFRVAVGILPRDAASFFRQLEPYGPGILLVLLALPFLTSGSISILYEVMAPAVNELTRLLAGVHGNVLG